MKLSLNLNVRLSACLVLSPKELQLFTESNLAFYICITLTSLQTMQQQQHFLRIICTSNAQHQA